MIGTANAEVIMESGSELILDFISPCGEFKVTFDDNGKVAYAYLIKGQAIVGDVWLYNRCQAPDEKEWQDHGNLPFANRQGFMTEEGQFKKPLTVDGVTVDWQYLKDQPTAYVRLFGEIAAKVSVNDKPGYSRLAARDSPLAKVWIESTPGK